MQENIEYKECRFVQYVPPPEQDMPDLHLVKECIHTKDGKTIPSINLLYDYPRPYWVVRKGARNFTQPKEWIKKEFLNEFKAPQRRLVEAIAMSMRKPWFQGNLRMLQEDPYLFGTDIKSTAVIKHAYQQKYKYTSESLYSIAYLDIETDISTEQQFITLISVYYEGRCITGATKNFFKGTKDFGEKVEKAMTKYLGEYVEKYQIQSELHVYDTEIELLYGIIQKVHELKPDFLAIWNMDYEMSRFIEACERARTDPAVIFTDPSVPKEYSYFNYKRGPAQKVTASGKITPIPPAARWHTVYCPASFYIIDAMCTFKHTRIGKPERPSYSLDSILDQELGLGKLRFKEADEFKGTKWHSVMQERYPVEYLIYNRFDVISMFLLEQKNKDMSFFLPLYSGASDFEDFKSQPRRLMDRLHWEVQEHGLVMGTTSKKLVDEYSDKINLTGWITNLAAELITKQPAPVIEEDIDHISTVYTNTGDLDVSASYPNGEVCYNISKETTVRELLKVEGIDEWVAKHENMLLITGHVDALQWCSNMLGFPKLDDVLKLYDEENSNGNNS